MFTESEVDFFVNEAKEKQIKEDLEDLKRAYNMKIMTLYRVGRVIKKWEDKLKCL